MIPTLVIFGIVLALAVAVAWRLSTERARPPLWPVGLQGDLPVVPDVHGCPHEPVDNL
jgi:hypothetical protein